MGQVEQVITIDLWGILGWNFTNTFWGHLKLTDYIL